MHREVLKRCPFCGGKAEMKTAQFSAVCPYKIGDKLVNESIRLNDDGTIDISKTADIITDIACIHYVKSGKVKFRYELDGSGAYIPLEKGQ